MPTRHFIQRKYARRQRPPASFRPYLWSLQWSALDVREDREDIILGVINEGSLAQWQRLITMYGKPTIRRVLARRLASEFHPESRALAKVIFGLRTFRHARRRAHH